MKKTSIGGSALIEGLMMIGPKNAAISIRKPDGEIFTELRDLPKRDKLVKIPILRGVISFFRQMILVFKAMMFSAKFVELEDEEVKTQGKLSKKFDEWLEKGLGKLFGDKAIDWIVYFAVAFSLVLTVVLFILLPNFLAGLLGFALEKNATHDFWQVVRLNLFEGLLRISFFFFYVYFASKLEDIKRVWQYHGAEHKTIHCYEAEEELTVENVRKYSTKHPRCGTSFMILVLLISVILFSFTGWHSIILNILIRLLLVPLVAGLSYELLKFAGRCEGRWIRILNAPGLAFQKLTTKEPDDLQIAVAIEAMKNVIVEEDKKLDEW